MSEGFHSREARASAANALSDLDAVLAGLRIIVRQCHDRQSAHQGVEADVISEAFDILSGGIEETISDANVTVSDLRDRLGTNDYYISAEETDTARPDYKTLLKDITVSVFPDEEIS